MQENSFQLTEKNQSEYTWSCIKLLFLLTRQNQITIKIKWKYVYLVLFNLCTGCEISEWSQGISSSQFTDVEHLPHDRAQHEDVVLLPVLTVQQHLVGQPREQNSGDVIIWRHSPFPVGTSYHDLILLRYWPLSKHLGSHPREQNSGDVIIWRHSPSPVGTSYHDVILLPYRQLRNTSGVSLENRTVVMS